MTDDVDATIEAMRLALRGVAAPVGVLLAHDGLEVRAATVTSTMSLDLAGRTMAIAVGTGRRIAPVLVPAAPCALSYLAAGQEHVADHFASRVDAERGVHPVRLGRDDAGRPVVPGALATFAGEVTARHAAGSHDIVVVQVASVTVEPGAEPLLWHDRDYAYADRRS